MQPDNFAKMMRVDTLAPLRIVNRYDDGVSECGMIAVMSSSEGSVAFNESDGDEAYCTSKVALNMRLRSIAAHLSGR